MSTGKPSARVWLGRHNRKAGCGVAPIFSSSVTAFLLVLVVLYRSPATETELGGHLPACAANDLCRSSCSALCETALPPALPDASYSHAEAVSGLLAAGCCSSRQMLDETFPRPGQRLLSTGGEGDDEDEVGAPDENLDELPAQLESRLSATPHRRTTQLQSTHLPGVNIDAGWSMDSHTQFPGLAGRFAGDGGDGAGQGKTLAPAKPPSQIATCCNSYFSQSSQKGPQQQLMQWSVVTQPPDTRDHALHQRVPSLLALQSAPRRLQSPAPVGPVTKWLNNWFRRSEAHHGNVVLEQKTSPGMQLEQLVQLSPEPQGGRDEQTLTLAPQQIGEQYYSPVPVTPSALAKNDFPPVEPEVHEMDWTPGYKKQVPGDLSIYSRRVPSVWVNTGMAEAPGTTLTQQSFALNMIQPRVERDERKLAMQFEAARLGRSNLTSSDGSPVLVADPVLALHRVMQRKGQMEWTIKHWNDDCADYSPHYVDSMPSSNVRNGETLDPCPTLQHRGEEEETRGLELAKDNDRNAYTDTAQAAGGTQPEAMTESDEENIDAKQEIVNTQDRANRSEKAESEAVEAAQSVLKDFHDVQINGAEYVPVYIPKNHPELATARFPHGVHHAGTRHAKHRNQERDDEAQGVYVARRGGLSDERGTGGSFSSKIAGVEQVVQGIMDSLSLTGARSVTARQAGKEDMETGQGTESRSQQQALLARLRGVVGELSTLRRGAGAGGHRASRQAMFQQQSQAGWGDYEMGQYAAAHMASPDMVTPWQAPTGSSIGNVVVPSAQGHQNSDHNILGTLPVTHKAVPAKRRLLPLAAGAAAGTGNTDAEKTAHGTGNTAHSVSTHSVSTATIEQAYHRAMHLARHGGGGGGVAHSGRRVQGHSGRGFKGSEMQVRSRRPMQRQQRRRKVGGMRLHKVKSSQLDAAAPVFFLAPSMRALCFILL